MKTTTRHMLASIMSADETITPAAVSAVFSMLEAMDGRTDEQKQADMVRDMRARLVNSRMTKTDLQQWFRANFCNASYSNTEKLSGELFDAVVANPSAYGLKRTGGKGKSMYSLDETGTPFAGEWNNAEKAPATDPRGQGAQTPFGLALLDGRTRRRGTGTVED